MHRFWLSDDEPEVVDAIRRVLEHAGFAVAVASSVGVRPGRSRRKRQPDVVVTGRDHCRRCMASSSSKGAARPLPGSGALIAISGGAAFGPLA